MSRGSVGRRRCRAAPSALLVSCLVVLLIVSITHLPTANAGLFNKKKDKGAASGDAKEKESADKGASTETAEIKSEPTESKTGGSSSSAPSKPPSIIEAEARTARDLSKAVQTLTKDLKTCNVRVEAIEEGFQSLYKAHLGNVDGLRKCKEGMLTTDDLKKLDNNLDKVNPTLLEQAKAKEDEKMRNDRLEELSSKHRELIHHLEDEVEKLVRREKSWERTISELVARRDLLEQREGAWERTIGDLMTEIEIREQREKWMESMKVDMKKRVAALSTYAVVEKFGAGPHYVSMIVMLEEGNPSSQKEIVFELAPLDLMPHSVHLFLSQIENGYWTRGTPAIAINAEHVIQACPHPCLDSVDMGGSLEGNPYEDMKAAGLDVVSFQEYTSKYPHTKYTIGFAGMPHSGPEFYINLMDNTLDHGTLDDRKAIMGNKYTTWAREVFGSEDDVDEKAFEPYPCFGKVIKGFKVVDEIAKGMTMASLPRGEEEEEEGTVRPDDNLLLRPVKIASVTILKDYTPDGEDNEMRKKKDEKKPPKEEL